MTFDLPLPFGPTIAVKHYVERTLSTRYMHKCMSKNWSSCGTL